MGSLQNIFFLAGDIDRKRYGGGLVLRRVICVGYWSLGVLLLALAAGQLETSEYWQQRLCDDYLGVKPCFLCRIKPQVSLLAFLAKEAERYRPAVDIYRSTRVDYSTSAYRSPHKVRIIMRHSNLFIDAEAFSQIMRV
ncbi:hypothetical protein EV356DRAFT_177216 [Viridothelium virens]|uniref:Uncharacterized protein n=1 Tax=Viridothelium virens TaxID=1048519 RepID=A0A6A6GRL9_VIRVR|nr:hypothetical protein EV356DRAFT_177216 [Viridothelium virens]